jgi:Calcineurin-like phosphoesterase
MNDIQYVCFSDMHLGADNSVLTNLGVGDTGVDPSKPSDVLVQIVDCLRTLLAQNSKGVRPSLVLNGDIFEFALSTDNLAAMAFQRFIEIAMPPDPKEWLFDRKIFYIPGNHDHHLWESAREIQYSMFLKRVPANRIINAPWHISRMINPKDVPSPFIEAVLERCPWLKDLQVVTVYPNYALTKGDKLVVFTHGHFTESIYSMMSSLKTAMFPDQPRPQTTEQWEAENFAWIDFFWSALGRSGLVGIDVERVYEKMQDPKAFTNFVADAAGNMLKLYGGNIGSHFGWLFALFIRMVVSGRMERGKPDSLLSDNGEGLRRYLELPLKQQIEDDLKAPLPEDITVVFGHTHKPFEQMMHVENFIRPSIRVYNSGGWVVDRPKAQKLYGGAVILLDDNLNVASLRMYNEADSPSGYAVTVGVAGPASNAANPLYTRIKQLINPQASPWTDFSRTVAAAVDTHTRKLAADLAKKT